MTTVVLHNFNSNNPEHHSFAEQSADTLNKIVESAEFYAEIEKLKFRYSRRRLDNGQYQQSTSAAEVVQLLKAGKELSSSPDNTIDLSVSIKRFPKRTTVGAVYPPSPIIHTSDRFFNRWMERQDPVSLAAHWIHEWLHIAGFKHKPKKFWQKPERRDVAYLVGNLTAVFGKEIYSQAEKRPYNYHTLGLDYIIASAEATTCED